MSGAFYRLLILTASTGGGHDARAEALCAWARAFYDDKVDIRVLRPLEGEATPLGNLGVGLYNLIQRRAPFLHHAYFSLIEVLGDLQGPWFFGRKEYERTLKEFKPQLVVSLHDFLNKGYFELAREILGEKVRCVTYCGEYGTGKGFSKHWVSTAAHKWIGRTEGALRAAYRRGIRPEAMERFTFFLPPDEVAALKTPPSRKALRLDNSMLTLLFASGRNGAIDNVRYLKALLPYRDKVQAIVVCGTNERRRREAEEWHHETQFPMIVEGYSSRLRTLTQLADVVIFKGGANTATRAFFEACPMYFDATGGVMPQERLTVDFFVNNGAGALVRSPKELAARVEAELGGAGRLSGMRLRLQALREAYRYPEAAEFFDALLSWGFFREETRRAILQGMSEEEVGARV